ncbi:hypothetical protein PZ895_00515 [Mesorhizobium sp. YIM 152430]|uniref:hypothetical protein n=1 Tax=Mesorhizobium sp. YIM 152430 TaxID=3031761 RepID=UPI0023DBBA60|nr:hypothetical protein [Mesorhizobium sp. YIM 152430]MDF1598259.1 hypothetical protein [Mesorhizobium sp. YIM 152430]
MQDVVRCAACDDEFRLIRFSERMFCYRCQPLGSAPPAVKQCRTCGIKVIGRRQFCVPCGQDRERARLREREQTRHRIRRPIAIPKEKACSRCRQVKPASAFYKHNGRTDGLSADCGACSRAHRKKVRRQRQNG